MLNVGLILFGCFCEQTFEQRACENYQARGTTVFFVEICSFRFTVPCMKETFLTRARNTSRKDIIPRSQKIKRRSFRYFTLSTKGSPPRFILAFLSNSHHSIKPELDGVEHFFVFRQNVFIVKVLFFSF